MTKQSKLLLAAWAIVIAAIFASICFKCKAASLLDNTSFQAELFGAYTAAEPGGFSTVLHTPIDHGKFGVGVAGNLWLGQNVGLKLDSVFVALDDVAAATIDYSSASFVLRFPTSIRLDPYGLAGIGRNWESERWNTHVGVGTALRITEYLGANVEARYIFESRRPDALQLRAGLTYSF
jgi:hypothetical protein